MTKTKWTVLAVAAILILAPLLGVVWLQGSIRGLIEEQGGKAFGVRTEVASADLSLFSGGLDLAGVRIENPEGFNSPQFVRAGRIRVTLAPATLFGETVHISEIEVEDVELNLESQRGKFNYRPILDHVSRSASPSGDGDSRPSGKKLLIGKLHISGIRARLDLGAGGAALATTTVEIPDQTFENLGSESDGTVLLRDLMGQIVRSLMRGVAVSGKGQLTRELLGNLWGQLSGETPTPGAPQKPPIEDVVKDLQDLLRKP